MTKPTTFDQDTSSETLPENGEGRTILSDVDGTLFLNLSGPPVINEQLVEFMLAAQDRGYHTQLHSGVERDLLHFKLLTRKSPAWAEYYQRYMASCAPGDEDLLCLSKNHTSREDAVVVFDDEHSKLDGKNWAPNDARIAATMAAWGVKGGNQDAKPAVSGTSTAGANPLKRGPKQA